MSLNSLLDKAISVANVAGKKTEEMVEASKLKLQEVSVNADLQDCYEKIGSLVYRSKKSGEDNEQAIDQLVEQADVLLEQLAQLQSKREEIKKMKKCPNCGAACSVDSNSAPDAAWCCTSRATWFRPSRRRNSHSRRNRQSSRSIRRKSF